MYLKILMLVFLLVVPFSHDVDLKEVKANNSEVIDSQTQKVINLIASLPITCSLSDEEDVKGARLAYDSLLPSQKVNVTNLLDLLDRENQIAQLYSKISYVVSLIENLPSVEDFKLSDETRLKEVINKYNELDYLQKDLVNNYNKLQGLINKLNGMYSLVEEISVLINNLPSKEVIDLSIYDKIQAIDLIYETLSIEQINMISNLNKYIDIKSILKKIDIIKDSINNLPEKLTYETLSIIESINSEYNTLTPSQKLLVTNYDEFLSLYNSILKAIEFNDLIDELINSISIDNKYLLDYLFNKYEEFNDNQKVFITNYQKLILLREELNKEEEYALIAKEVIDLINKLPIEITLNEKEKVKEARKKYDDLYDNSKKYVDNYHLLLQAEATISKLENQEDIKELENLYNELDKTLDEINEIRNDIKEDENKSQELVDEIKNFLEEIKENEAKGLNKYIIIAIGLTSVFVVVAVIYIFSLHRSKVNLEEEQF